jgi:hypothetical protein
MRGIIAVLAVMMLIGTIHPVILTSGDAGEGWAENISAEQCLEEGVDSVYICNGNVVRVVHTADGAGSTFYEPDGNVVNCPVVAPSQMGAECVQMTRPHFCAGESVCGDSREHVFPGHSDYEEEIEDLPNETEEVVEEIDEPEVIEEEENPVPEEDEFEEEETEVIEPNVPKKPKSQPTAGGVLDNLALVVLGLAVLSVLVLYLLFRKTIGK